MTSKTTPLTDIGQFYKQIDDFKTKIIKILTSLNKKEGIVEINKYHDKLTMAKKASVRMPIELLYQYGISSKNNEGKYLYAEKILLRDQQFFLGEADKAEEIAQNNNYELKQNDLLFISQIKEIWGDLEETVQKNIWNYVQVICFLAEKIVKGNVLASEKQRLKSLGLLQ